jgi:hypothetical protein
MALRQGLNHHGYDKMILVTEAPEGCKGPSSSNTKSTWRLWCGHVGPNLATRLAVVLFPGDVGVILTRTPALPSLASDNYSFGKIYIVRHVSSPTTFSLPKLGSRHDLGEDPRVISFLQPKWPSHDE